MVASNTDRVVVPHPLKHVDVSGAAASTTLKQEHTLLERDHEGRVFEQLQQEKLSFLILLFLILQLKKEKAYNNVFTGMDRTLTADVSVPTHTETTSMRLLLISWGIMSKPASHWSSAMNGRRVFRW